MAVVSTSREVAWWLGIDTNTLPDLRDTLANPHDYHPRMLEALMRGRPGNVSRGGGRQQLDQRPDGEFLWSAWTYGLLEPDKRRGGTKKRDSYGSWRYGTPRAEVAPYANAHAEADAAWRGANTNSLAATLKDGRPRRQRPPQWSLFSCERIPRKPLRPFVIGGAA